MALINLGHLRAASGPEGNLALVTLRRDAANWDSSPRLSEGALPPAS